MKILVIDDEPKAANQLAKGLAEAGYEVDAAYDGQTGLEYARDLTYGLIISDIMMPGFDGFSIVHELRRIGRDVPLLFVTARHDIEARVRGLDLGADDYLVKPFAFPELLARIRALLRRGPAPKSLVLKADNLSLDLQSRRVVRAGHRIDLTPKEFSLLQFFLERKGEVVSRALIAQHVWDMQFDSGTNAIDVQIKRLRMKIEPPGSTPLIRTVRGVGYVLEQPTQEG